MPPIVIDPPPDDGRTDPPPPDPPAPKPKTRYYDSVRVDAQRAKRDLNQIADEIIVRLAAIPGADVRATVEIASDNADGFGDAAMRTICEGSRTLNFDGYDFEE